VSASGWRPNLRPYSSRREERFRSLLRFAEADGGYKGPKRLITEVRGERGSRVAVLECGHLTPVGAPKGSRSGNRIDPRRSLWRHCLECLRASTEEVP
jgi:hypothetical protein